MTRDELLPVAQRSLGADHDLTLGLQHRLAVTIMEVVETGNDVLEAETIMQDVAQRRRRVSGPAHPDTLSAEKMLSIVRERLGQMREQNGQADWPSGG